MSRFVVVSRERHGRKKWLRFNGYDFAATTALAPIVGVELMRATVVSMPCAFVQHPGGFTLVSVLSPIPGRNMFVGPGGKWLGPYVPAWFRLYPFRMLPAQGTNRIELSVDEDSGLVVDSDAVGEEFFDREGKHTPALQRVFDTLTLVERSRALSDAGVAALAQAGVIRPWQITIKSEQGDQPISGLHTIDEAALQALPDDAFLKLRTATALPIAYAQMLSAGQIGVFERLARSHQPPPPEPMTPLPETIDSLLENLNKGDLLRFG